MLLLNYSRILIGWLSIRHIEVVINISFDPLVQAEGVKQVDSTMPCVSAVIDYI